MTMRRRIAGAALVASALVVGSALAQQPRPQPAPRSSSGGGGSSGGGVSVDVTQLLSGLGSLWRRQPPYAERRVLAWIDAGPDTPEIARELAAIGRAELVATYALPSAAAELLVFETPRDLDAAIEALAADPRVREAQRDYFHATVGDAAPLAPDWSDAELRGRALRSLASGAGVRIAVIDGGVDRAHPALANAAIVERDLTGEGAAAEAHATAVVGALVGNGAGGVAGLAPGAEVLALRACIAPRPDAMPARCLTSNLARALDAALAAGSRVINLSVAGPPDRIVARMVAAAVRAGALVVAAAGNGGPRAAPAFPAALSPVLAVTAVDARGRLYRKANRGEYVDLAAPGVELRCLTTRAGSALASGTSFAAPRVSAAAALLLELDGALAADRLAALLAETARDAGPRGADREFGAGIVDPCAAAARLTAGRVRCAGP
jgi:subtilisin family serine protease